MDAYGNGHEYRSTACQHDLHGECRNHCKFCNMWCNCECHGFHEPEEE